MATSGPPERPITKKDEDTLGRGPFVERLTSALISEHGKSTGVVLGLTGPWGSGKSSILNLLREEISSRHPSAIVVSFDPWLVSGRNDLIAEFISELLGTIRLHSKRDAKLKSLAKTVAKYGAHVAPAGNLIVPGAGTVAAGGFKAIEEALGKGESLRELRQKLLSSLDAVSSPIVVLVDELDRVDDQEIKTVAQLVRSVVDFPGISYVLAYDTDRVVQALGSGPGENRARERGRSYLEKIVQLQLPLPVGLPQERTDQLNAELSAIAAGVSVPSDFSQNERYMDCSQALVEEVLQTPRDIKRLIGAYHAIAGMVGREVDWLDLLQYSALLSKAPGTVEKIKSDPESYVQDPLSMLEYTRRMGEQSGDRDRLLDNSIAAGENNKATKALLKSLFPRFSDGNSPSHTDALCYRRALMTTLRLGLLPGGVSRTRIEQVFGQPANGIAEALSRALKSDEFGALIDRLDEVYVTLDVDHLQVWAGVRHFLARNGDASPPPDEISLMRTISENFASLLNRAVKRSGPFLLTAHDVVFQSAQDQDVVLLPIWIRRQIMHHGLFRWSSRAGEGADILTSSETETLALSCAAAWKHRLLQGALLEHIWDLHAIYTIVDVGLWSAPCKAAMRRALRENKHFDGVIVQMFGANYFTDESSVDLLIGTKWLKQRISQRLDDADATAPSVDVASAARKALDGHP